MHRKHSIHALVYNKLFPNPRPEDPPTFSAHLSKHLVAEVRIETATFYGSLDTVEARYPGLNYSHPPHRKRLGRFPHHARLFKAFDELRLTSSEIASLCRWEGTLWARERYERDEGIKVIDSTGKEIGPWVDHRERRKQKASIKVKTDIEVEIVEAQSAEHEVVDEPMEDEEDQEESDEDAAVPDGFINDRIRQAVRFHSQDMPLDADWEDFMDKDMDPRSQNPTISNVGTGPTPRLLPQSLRAPMRPTAPASSNVH